MFSLAITIISLFTSSVCDDRLKMNFDDGDGVESFDNSEKFIEQAATTSRVLRCIRN